MKDRLAVEVQNVSKVFPGLSGRPGNEVLAVDDVTLAIQDGEFFSLLGPSGCGKTTTLRMIAGFEHPTEGEIYIHGKPMGLTPPYQRNTNMVFQSYALFPHMTIARNVAFGLEMKKFAKDEVELTPVALMIVGNKLQAGYRSGYLICLYELSAPVITGSQEPDRVVAVQTQPVPDDGQSLVILLPVEVYRREGQPVFDVGRTQFQGLPVMDFGFRVTTCFLAEVGQA